MAGRTRGMLLATLVAAWPGLAGAADLTVEVRDADGKPVRDAVVVLAAKGGAGTAKEPRIVDQVNEEFRPYVQVVRAGSQIVFRNSDETRHHVFSFSDARPLETQLNPGDSSAAMAFDKPGVVALGCNIHDHMSAFVYVTDSAHAAVTGEDGRAVLAGAPEGAHTLRVWTPRLKPGAPEHEQPVTVAAGAAVTVPLAGLLPDRRPSADAERSSY
ncbi:MAG TPA: hypothetical protein VEB20_11580 [Azospirillaceae bacterium]|nr:hypothetical protein [Azospirillaceae bacterium]